MRVQDFIIPLGGKIPVGGDLKKVKLRKASGPVFIDTGRERVPLELGELAVIPETVKSIVVVNEHDAVNVVQLVIMETGGADLISPSSSVAINNEPVVKIKAGASLVGLPKKTVVSDGSSFVIDGNGARRRLDIVASGNNLGVLWVGSDVAETGIPMEANDEYSADVSGDLKIFGTKAGDVLYITEVI